MPFITMFTEQWAESPSQCTKIRKKIIYSWKIVKRIKLFILIVNVTININTQEILHKIIKYAYNNFYCLLKLLKQEHLARFLETQIKMQKLYF
jgi:hypothetical protein